MVNHKNHNEQQLAQKQPRESPSNRHRTKATATAQKRKAQDLLCSSIRGSLCNIIQAMTPMIAPLMTPEKINTGK